MNSSVNLHYYGSDLSLSSLSALSLVRYFIILRTYFVKPLEPEPKILHVVVLGIEFVFNKDLSVDIVHGRWIKSKVNDNTWSYVTLTSSLYSAAATETILPGNVQYVDILEVSDIGYVCKLCGTDSPLSESVVHLEAVHGLSMQQSQEISIAASSVSLREDSISSMNAPSVQHSSAVHLTNMENSVGDQAPSSLQEIIPPSTSNVERGNIHLNIKWKQDLIDTFKAEVVPDWRRETLEAWRDNKSYTVEDRKLFIKTRAEIIKGLVDHMYTFFGKICDPSQKQINCIVTDLLVASYPWMFSQGENSASKIPELNRGKGCGGDQGIGGLSFQLWDAFYRKKTEILKDDGGVLSEKGKHGNTKGDYYQRLYLKQNFEG